MTEQLTNPAQRPLRDLIADDSYVTAFRRWDLTALPSCNTRMPSTPSQPKLEWPN